jgi:hypothetical protein
MPEPTATVSTEEAKPSLAPKPAVKAPKIMQAPAPVTRGSAPAGTSGWGDLAKPAKIPKYLMRNEVYDNIYNRPQKR